MAKKVTRLPREADRTKLPLHVRHQLLMEAGYKCGNPACRNVITLELHHIQYVSDGGGDDPSNLLVLCPYCHSMHHAGHIPVEAIRLWKGLLVALNQGFDRQGMELLLFLHKTKDNQLWYSADGLLSFAGLIGAGLVEIAQTEMTFMAPNERRKFTQTSHKLMMTERGRLLIEAWLAVNEQRYRELVSAGGPPPGAKPAEPDAAANRRPASEGAL
jgi:hypothetical protein